jgi:hypothetical protein
MRYFIDQLELDHASGISQSVMPSATTNIWGTANEAAAGGLP